MSKHLSHLKPVIYLLAVFFFNQVQAQIPQQLNYQAIARKADGSPISFQDITVRISIVDSAASGFPADRIPYSETRKVKTNFAGLFNIVIGGPDALSVSGSLKNVNWITGKKLIRVEIDPGGSNNFLLLGLTELQSVPYALFALNTAGSNNIVSGAASGDLTGNYPAPSIAGKAITTDKLADTSITFQKLSQPVQSALSNAINVNDTAAMLKGYAKTGNLPQPGVNSVSLTTLNGITGSISNATSSPTVLLGLGDITPTSVVASSGISASSITGVIKTASQPFITNIGPLSNLSVNGPLQASSLGGSIITPAQPNITSLGTLSDLSVNGTIQGININAANANLTNITGLNALTLTGNITSNTLSSVSGTIGNLSVPGTIITESINATNVNLTNINGLNALTLTGNLTSNTLSSTGAIIGNLTVSGTLTGTLQTAAQPNITSVGQLTALSVSGAVNAGTLSGILSAGTQRNITGLGTLSNLSVSGTVESNTVSATTVNTTLIAGLKNLTVTGTIVASRLTISGMITSGSISSGSATLTGITGLSLPSGTLSDTFVTISGGVLKQTVFTPTDVTFASDFTVTGVTNYLKWVDGENVPAKGLTAVQLLQLGAVKTIHPTYTAPALSIGISPSAGNVEIGSNISVTLSSTFTQNDGGSATTTTYKKGVTNLGSNTDNITNITSAISYTVSADYAQGACKNDNQGTQDCTGRITAGTVNSSSVTYTPLGKRYWGYASSNTPTDTDIKNAAGGGSELNSSKAKTSFSITPPGANYVFFAYPASLGSLTSITVGGFESISAFTLTARTVVNASGYSQTYNVYVSNNTFSSVVSGIITN